MRLVGDVEPEEFAADVGDQIVALEALLAGQAARVERQGRGHGGAQPHPFIVQPGRAPVGQLPVIFVPPLGDREGRLGAEFAVDKALQEARPILPVQRHDASATLLLGLRSLGAAGRPGGDRGDGKGGRSRRNEHQGESRRHSLPPRYAPAHRASFCTRTGARASAKLFQSRHQCWNKAARPAARTETWLFPRTRG